MVVVGVWVVMSTELLVNAVGIASLVVEEIESLVNVLGTELLVVA